MSRINYPEIEVESEIEWRELEARDVRRRLEQAVNAEDRRVLARQLKELEDQVEERRRQLPW